MYSLSLFLYNSKGLLLVVHISDAMRNGGNEITVPNSDFMILTKASYPNTNNNDYSLEEKNHNPFLNMASSLSQAHTA